MKELKTIFVSIDPTTNKQLALERAAAIAKKCQHMNDYTQKLPLDFISTFVELIP